MRRPDQSLTKTTNPPIRIFFLTVTPRCHTTCNLSSQTPKKADQKVLLDDTTRLCRNPHACLIPRARLCGPSQRKAYIQRHKKRAQRANNRPCTPCSIATPYMWWGRGGTHQPGKRAANERRHSGQRLATTGRGGNQKVNKRASRPPPVAGFVAGCCAVGGPWGPKRSPPKLHQSVWGKNRNPIGGGD